MPERLHKLIIVQAKEQHQFKVTYVVSAITKNADDNLAGGDGTVNKDQIVGFTYVGDDKVAAGLAKN